MAKPALIAEIEELAEAVGKTVAIGRQGHKSEWFAHCDGIETYGPTPQAAVKALKNQMLSRESQALREAESVRRRFDALQAVVAK